MIQSFEMMDGTPDVTADEVAHLLIPGRYRSQDGMGLSEFSAQRVATAADFYVAHLLDQQEGLIVCSGYKNPADPNNTPWSPGDGTVYDGIPEAYSMKRMLKRDYSIHGESIKVEPRSVDTVTNFTNSQALFPEDGERPVAIVAQEQHLERMLKIIAPHTMRRPYIGLVVPEIESKPDVDSSIGALVSKWVVRGLTPDNSGSAEIASRRINNVWRVLLAPRHLKQSLIHSGQRQAA